MKKKEWVKRLETAMGEKAESSYVKGDQYHCVFKGCVPRTVRSIELHDDDPFYCLFHFHWNQNHTQVYVNTTDFIRLVWNEDGKEIRGMEFIHNYMGCSTESFSQLSSKHEEVVDWVYDHYVSNAKNRLEIVTTY